MKEGTMPRQIAGLKLYDLAEIATSLDLSTITLRTYIQKGRLKALKIGRSYRVREEDLMDFLLQRNQGRNAKPLLEIPTGDLGQLRETDTQQVYEEHLNGKMEPKR